MEEAGVHDAQTNKRGCGDDNRREIMQTHGASASLIRPETCRIKCLLELRLSASIRRNGKKQQGQDFCVHSNKEKKTIA
ncbi:hypothetical protein GHT06_013153 [Daphnia sinensis]|uniref:Uncharacterized protein n=1 Tax=Daphnia sinensis TaxID=1820382 RepID=A0AAD5LQN7_9CRUS|nr:hypothetical protein GHT06_013153 [Daphnia sinensis]